MKKLQGHKKGQRALELRKEGHAYEPISEQMGYSTPSASYKAVTRRLRDMDRPTQCQCCVNWKYSVWMQCCIVHV